MNRKLLFLLDIVLVGVVVSVGIQFRDARRAARAREAEKLSRQLKPPPPPQFTPLAQVPAVSPLGYETIASKMLFDRSRNSVVIVEPPPQPPPIPMPPLPSYHGMMNIGVTTAFFSTSAESQHLAIHIGESIGQFKLLDVNSEEVTLEWNGKTVRKTVAELSARTMGGGNAPQVAQGVRTEGPSAPPAPAAAVKSGPGETTAFGFKTCSVTDGNAEGAVVDGYKKVMHTSPFGQNCTWEPVSK